MAHTRLWEASHRYRDLPADYIAPSGKFWLDAMPHVSGDSGGEIASRQEAEDAVSAAGSAPTGPRTFLDAARALNSRHHRNFTLSVLAAATAAGDLEEGSLDHNALLLGTILDHLLSTRDLIQDAASIRRLEQCAWEGNHPVCHLALAYRKQQGVGVAQSCKQAVAHYRIVAAMGLSFQHMDGASFPMNDVRLNQFMEVRAQQHKDHIMEQKQEQARRGDPVAAVVVGSHVYREERDLHKAARLFQAAADKGDDWGLNNLGSMLLNGLGGLKQDHTLAVQCFNRSAALVNPWGMYNLAICFLYGYGVQPNHTAALEWLNASAKWDNPAAHVMLGSRYRDGQGLPKNIAQAYFHFDKASKLGEVEALASLGVMLLDASYYEPNCKVAHKALKLAAERGPWGSVVKEAYDAFAAGDEMGAFSRYRLAAELGYRTAQANLAFLYERGVAPYVPQNYAAAHGYYSLAAAQGDVPSQRRLGDLYFYGLVGDAPDMALAFEAYQSYGSDAESLHSLAHMYEHGLGTQRNVTLALETYAKSQALRFARERRACYACGFRSIYIDMYTHVYMYLSLSMYICMYICIYMYAYVYIYVYTYICTDIDTFIYIHVSYVYTHVHVEVSLVYAQVIFDTYEAYCSDAAKRNTSAQALSSREGALASNLAIVSLNLRETVSSAASLLGSFFSSAPPPPPPPPPLLEEGKTEL